MKTIKLTFFALLITLSTSVFAQDSNTLLWKISGNGLESPSYLFGTIHVKCPDDIKLSDQAKSAFASSEQLVLELDMDDPNFMTKMQQLSMNEGMKNISSELSEENLEILNSFFKKHYGVDMSQFGVMKPFVLQTLMFMKSLDCPQTGSYEEAFMAKAKENKWEIGGLEEIEDQISIFDAVPVKEQLNWLMKYAKDEAKLKSSVEKMLLAYDNQDTEAIIALFKEFPEYQNLEDAMLYNRNKKWIAVIQNYAKNKSTFFAVGAAHLGSDKGVIALLQKEGYTLTPITNLIN